MAKTHFSLSHDPMLLNAPTGFTVTVRDIRAYTGSGWLVLLLGDMQTMPGLGVKPAAFDVDIDEREDGRPVLSPTRNTLLLADTGLRVTRPGSPDRGERAVAYTDVAFEELLDLIAAETPAPEAAPSPPS